MGLSSMTGFARVEGRTGDWAWSWEARSVNGKGLDIRLRIPPGFESIEVPARQRAAIERAARLAAWLRRRFGVPPDHVVPHYFWTMHRFNNWHKPCPRILMDGGRPGAKWEAFLRLVGRS